MTYLTDKDRGDLESTTLHSVYSVEKRGMDLSVSQNACNSNLVSTTEEVGYEVCSIVFSPLVSPNEEGLSKLKFVSQNLCHSTYVCSANEINRKLVCFPPPCVWSRRLGAS